MSLLTAEFLECTPYASVPPATTVLATSTVFVTAYTVTLPAACPTSEWDATYTITTTCTGDRAHWTAPAIPPEFAVTTVVCDVCAHKTQTITCPNAGVTDLAVAGNGVTVTVAPTPTPAAANTAAPAPAPANMGAPAAGGAAPAAAAAAAPAAAGAPAAESAAPAAESGAPVAGVPAAVAPAAVAPAAVAPAAVAPAAVAPAAVAPAPAAAAPAPASAAPTVASVSPPAAAATGTDFVTVNGAPLSMKKSLGLMAGLALVAGQFLML